MLRKKILSLALVFAASTLAAGLASADTINVSNFNAGGSNFVSGGVAHYFYDVTLDGSADVVAPGDGFVIFDFPGYIDGSATFVSPFSPSVSDLGTFSLTDQALVGTSLNGYSAQPGNQAQFPTNTGFESANDNPSIANLTFTYSGSTYVASGNVSTSAELEIDSSITETGTTFVAAVGVDNSGSSQSASASLNAVDAPRPSFGSSVPLPLASLGGGTLFVLLGLMRFMKSRRADA